MHTAHDTNACSTSESTSSREKEQLQKCCWIRARKRNGEAWGNGREEKKKKKICTSEERSSAKKKVGKEEEDDEEEEITNA